MIAGASFTASDLTVTVRSLQARNDGAEIAVCVLLENGEQKEERRLLITAEQYCELRPVRGEITEEAFERLEAASVLCGAIRSGENLLSYGANSAQMLAQKLMRKGFSRDVATEAAQKLQQMGLIDEQSDLRRELERSVAKLWGAKRIRAHLWSRGFGTDAMAELPALLEEIDFAANCAALIRKHYTGVPTDADERRRMIASLSRYGYSITEIRDAFVMVERG